MGAVGLREDGITGEVTLRRHTQMDNPVQLVFKGKLRMEDKGYKAVEFESLEGRGMPKKECG